MDVALLKEFAQWGIAGLFAGVMLYLMIRQTDMHTRSMTNLTERWEKMADDLRLVVRENTVAFTTSVQAIQAMQRQMDRWDGMERRSARRSGGG